jgi:ribonuclease J
VSGAFRVVALGGLGEVGMNCLVVEAAGRLMLVDCGVTFPDREPGVDLIHPDFESIVARAEQLEGVVLTHGHEDHIGALPYLLRRLGRRDLPIHGPPYALGLVEERLREAELPGVRLIETEPRRAIGLGPFGVTPYRVTHSIPDCTGLVVRVPGAILIHSGDFKIDEDPVDGQRFDEELLADVGREGVRLLLSDSTNSETDGCAGGERPVAAAIEALMLQVKGRVVLGMFASNVHRLSAVLDVARRLGRRVLFLGRALHTHARVADSLAVMTYDHALLVSPSEAAQLPRDRLLIVATGSQGEARAALRRLAHGAHPAIKLDPGDEVIMSSRTIPGRERPIHTTVDAFERRGVRVWTRRDDAALHVSGHACRDEQRRMIELTRPRGFTPVHGAFVHMQRHAALARELGVPEILVIENGNLLAVDDSGMRVVDQVPTGRVHVQHGNEVAREALRDRLRIAESGIVVVMAELGPDSQPRRRPRVVVRGVVGESELAKQGLRERAEDAALLALQGLAPGADDETCEITAARAARRIFRQALGWRPVVHAVIQRPES